MPLHFEDIDVVTEAKGSSSALIVPCNMCPAATVADRENKPFLRLFNKFLKSAPFEKIHLCVARPIKGARSSFKGVQESFTSPVVSMHVDSCQTEKVAQTGKTI